MTMTEPTLDQDGYPTDETIEAIEHWPHDDFPALMRFVAAAWKWGGLENKPSKIEPLFDPEFEDDGRYWCGATGGWSGNESLVAALQRNGMFLCFCWNASVRGGYVEYHLPPEAEDEA